MGLAHCKQATGELEAGVGLAHDEEPLAGVAGGIARVDVVGRVLDAGHVGGQQRLGRTDREDRHPRAVVARGCVQHEQVPVSRGAQPGRVVADGEAGASDELDHAGFHLGPRGELRRAVHEPGHDRPVRGSRAMRLLKS